MASSKLRATVICQRDGKVLLVRKAKAKWTLPGGKIECDEGPIEAAWREMIEETGMEPQDFEFLGWHEFEGGAHHVYRMTVSATMNARPQNEIRDCRWFGKTELADEAVKDSSQELLSLYCQLA